MMAVYHRQRWVTADPEDPLPLAVEYMEKALKLDPSFQEANSLLSGFYFSGARTGTMPEEAYAKAREYAEKAIAVDETTALAQQTKASILWQYDRRWEEAERLCRRAAEIDPGVLEKLVERDLYYLGWQYSGPLKGQDT